MKKLLLVTIVFLTLTVAQAQTTFQKTYGGASNDAGYSVQQTIDGGYVITGTTLSFGVGGYDVYIIKIDSIGNLLWTKTFGGSDGDDKGTSIITTIDGGFAVCGFTGSFSAIGYDMYIIKLDGNGNLQ